MKESNKSLIKIIMITVAAPILVFAVAGMMNVLFPVKDAAKGIVLENRYKSNRTDSIKAVIRYLESGNNYLAVDKGNFHFGAYQMNVVTIGMYSPSLIEYDSVTHTHCADKFLKSGKLQEEIMTKSIAYYDSLFAPQLELLKHYKTPYVTNLPPDWWIYWSHRYGICATFHFINDLIYHKVGTDHYKMEHYQYLYSIKDSLRSKTFNAHLLYH